MLGALPVLLFPTMDDAVAFALAWSSCNGLLVASPSTAVDFVHAPFALVPAQVRVHGALWWDGVSRDCAVLRPRVCRIVQPSTDSKEAVPTSRRTRTTL